METETGVWKPEVGKTAWFITGHKVIEGMITEAGKFLGDSYQFEGNGLRSFIFTEFLYPTAEAALASIKIFDLDGKEVVIPAVGVGGRGYLNSTIRIEDMAAVSGLSACAGKSSTTEPTPIAGARPPLPPSKNGG